MNHAARGHGCPAGKRSPAAACPSQTFVRLRCSGQAAWFDSQGRVLQAGGAPVSTRRGWRRGAGSSPAPPTKHPGQFSGRAERRTPVRHALPLVRTRPVLCRAAERSTVDGRPDTREMSERGNVDHERLRRYRHRVSRLVLHRRHRRPICRYLGREAAAMTGDLRRRDRLHRLMHRRHEDNAVRCWLRLLTLHRLPGVVVGHIERDVADWWLNCAFICEVSR